jgi:hypothetical protein
LPEPEQADGLWAVRRLLPSGCRRLFACSYGGSGMELPSHRHLVPRLRMSGGIPPPLHGVAFGYSQEHFFFAFSLVFSSSPLLYSALYFIFLFVSFFSLFLLVYTSLLPLLMFHFRPFAFTVVFCLFVKLCFLFVFFALRFFITAADS